MTAQYIGRGIVVMDHVIKSKEPGPTESIISIFWESECKVVSVAIATEDVRDGAAACFVGFDEDNILLWNTAKKRKEKKRH